MASKGKVCLLDRLLNEAWFADEKQAEAWVMERKVMIDNHPAASVKEIVKTDSIIRVKEYYKTKYVNKGGYKLEGAMKGFSLDIKGKVALDCGASTGGFTDCLLYHGAAHVYAVDVGYGQLAGKLAIHPKVTNMEKTNLSDAILLELYPPPELITLDLSYLSLKKAVPVCREILHGRGTIIALIKPLFEVEASQLRRTGKIEDHDVLCNLLWDLCTHFSKTGFDVKGLTYSPIRGNNGTVEYFIHLSCDADECLELNHCFEERIPTIVSQSLTIDPFHKG